MKFIENIFLFKKGIATAIELDLRPLGKMMIFRDTHTNRTFLLYIDSSSKMAKEHKYKECNQNVAEM